MAAVAARATLVAAMSSSRPAAVDLYWIPLGAGGHCVRFNGRVFEAIQAAHEHRRRDDLYHVALVVELDGDRYAIELTPSPDADGAARGVVATGAVGSRRLARLRLFRYEVRCWRGGSIPDLDWAVGGACRVSGDRAVALRLLDLLPAVPTPVWGRDELRAGEMWNSNSVIAWALVSAGVPAELLRPPPRGRAPGWDAGLLVARRSLPPDRGDRARTPAPRPPASETPARRGRRRRARRRQAARSAASRVTSSASEPATNPPERTMNASS